MRSAAALEVLANKDRLEALYKTKSQMSISKMLHVTPQTVRRWERYHGLSRPRAEAKDPAMRETFDKIPKP